VRLWPAYIIVGLLLISLGWIWLFADIARGRQYQIIPTMGVSLLAGLLLLVWFVGFSRLSRRLRLSVLIGVLLVVCMTLSLVRVRGVTGDWVPILVFRWHTPPTPPPLPSVASPSEPTSAPAATIPADTPTATPNTPKAVPSAVAEPPIHRPREGDFPQFLGPARDSQIRGLRLARDWVAHPPRRLWRQPIGEAWSGFAVAGELAVTQEQRAGEERVVAYDLLTGRVRWSHADTVRYETFIAGIGPRATPTIAGGRVFTMGATGILNALDLATGRRVWSRQVVKENSAELPEWGKSSSPLVLGSRVIVSAGGKENRSLVAYDAANGEPVWAGGTGGASYSSPVLVELAGRKQILMLNERTVVGHDSETGGVLWEHAWPSGLNVTSPVLLSGDRVLVSTGYGIGSKVFRIAPGPDGALHAEVDWTSLRLKSKFANLVVHDGWVFGLDDGVLTCLDPSTGERKWKAGRYGHGQLLLVEDVLLVQTEEGEVVLLEPNPEGQKELTRFTALDGKTWNPPALAGRYLVVRNDREAAVYELSLLH
jgi:outer membrane protein assembly factor BamB